MVIDLRSDTVTRPSREMLEAMNCAQVGDDVFGEDPSINQLETQAAQFFGFEAALFCPSGTMCNQIAVRLLTQAQDELFIHPSSHINSYEGGGVAFHARVHTTVVSGEKGKITPAAVKKHFRPANDHFPTPSLVALENTTNMGGGHYYTEEELAQWSQFAKEHKLSLHLDGARLVNALCETQISPKKIGQWFDTATVCFSKALGAPVGSVILSTAENKKKARRLRKVMGGGMRQAGYLAAAASYALQNHWEDVKLDHQHAQNISAQLIGKGLMSADHVTPTNIVLFELQRGVLASEFVSYLQEKNIKILALDEKRVRLITHRDFLPEQLDYLLDVIEKAPF